MSELKRIIGYIPVNEKAELKSKAILSGKTEQELVSEFVLNNLKGETNGSQEESSSKEKASKEKASKEKASNKKSKGSVN